MCDQISHKETDARVQSVPLLGDQSVNGLYRNDRYLLRDPHGKHM